MSQPIAEQNRKRPAAKSAPAGSPLSPTPSDLVLRTREPGSATTIIRSGKYPVNLATARIVAPDQLAGPDELRELRELQAQAEEITSVASKQSPNFITDAHKSFRLDGDLSAAKLADASLPLAEKIKRGKEIKEALHVSLKAIQRAASPTCAKVLRVAIAFGQNEVATILRSETELAERLGIPHEPSESLVSLASVVASLDSRAKSVERGEIYGWATPGTILAGVLDLSPSAAARPD